MQLWFSVVVPPTLDPPLPLNVCLVSTALSRTAVPPVVEMLGVPLFTLDAFSIFHPEWLESPPPKLQPAAGATSGGDLPQLQSRDTANGGSRVGQT